MTAGPAVSRDNLGFLLAKASQRWNELLYAGFVEAGFPEVRASYGSVLVPLFEEDGLRMGEIAARSRLSKQTMTTLVRLTERAGLTIREKDPSDGRAAQIYLSARGRQLAPVAERVVGDMEDLVASRIGPRQRAALSRSLKQASELPDGASRAPAP
jgi:MarR family transcriptional regulator, organic hydroperoxide resistance regulator